MAEKRKFTEEQLQQLRDVWNEFSLEEILSMGKEFGEWDVADLANYIDDDADDETKSEVLSRYTKTEMIEELEERYDISSILADIGDGDVLGYYDDDELLAALYGTETLNEYVQDVVDEKMEELLDDDGAYVFSDNPDEVHRSIATLLRRSYFDKDTPKDFKEFINKNTYNVQYT